MSQNVAVNCYKLDTVYIYFDLIAAKTVMPVPLDLLALSASACVYVRVRAFTVCVCEHISSDSRPCATAELATGTPQLSGIMSSPVRL